MFTYLPLFLLFLNIFLIYDEEDTLFRYFNWIINNNGTATVSYSKKYTFNI